MLGLARGAARCNDPGSVVLRPVTAVEAGAIGGFRGEAGLTHVREERAFR